MKRILFSEVLRERQLLQRRRSGVPDDRRGGSGEPRLDAVRELADVRGETGRPVPDAGAPLIREEPPHRVSPLLQHSHVLV